MILVGPDLKEDLGALYLRLRHAVVNDGATLIELTPTRTGLSGIATHTLSPRPGEVALLAEAFVDARTVMRWTPPACRLAPSRGGCVDSGPVTVILGRASVADSAVSVADAATALRRLEGVRFLSALRRGNVHGALDVGLAPGLLPGRQPLAAGCEAWPSVPPAAGLDTAAMLSAPPSADSTSSCSAPTRSPTSRRGSRPERSTPSGP